MEHNRENLSRQNGWKRAPFSEKTGMWVCPICGQIKPLEQPCVRCGFDMRTDFLNLRTIAPVPQDDAKKRQVCVSDEKVRSEQERQERERKAREEREREERERKAREERERQERERKAREERERLERERKEKKEQERREREEKRKSRMQMIIPQLGRMAEQKEKKEQEELEWQQKLLQQAREDRERLTRERKAREEQACFNAEYAQKKQESIEQESNEGEDQTQDDPDLTAQREQKRVNQQEKLTNLKLWMFIVFVFIFVFFDPDLPVFSVLCIVIDIVLFFYYTKEKMR